MVSITKGYVFWHDYESKGEKKKVPSLRIYFPIRELSKEEKEALSTNDPRFLIYRFEDSFLLKPIFNNDEKSNLVTTKHNILQDLLNNLAKHLNTNPIQVIPIEECGNHSEVAEEKNNLNKQNALNDLDAFLNSLDVLKMALDDKDLTSEMLFNQFKDSFTQIKKLIEGI